MTSVSTLVFLKAVFSGLVGTHFSHYILLVLFLLVLDLHFMSILKERKRAFSKSFSVLQHPSRRVSPFSSFLDLATIYEVRLVP